MPSWIAAIGSAELGDFEPSMNRRRIAKKNVAEIIEACVNDPKNEELRRKSILELSHYILSGDRYRGEIDALRKYIRQLQLEAAGTSDVGDVGGSLCNPWMRP